MTDSYSSMPRRLGRGTRLNGIYEIEQQIAAGGMGEVYKAHAIQTGDPIAIKMMLPELAENEAALALFRKEASALHYLQHDAIVRYYVFTIEPQLQRPYLAMEFVDGRPLSDILGDGPLTFEAVRALMQRLAAGLDAAHQRGIIHRDVSPDNVIVPSGDVSRAKIIDFGIARSTQLNKEGTIIGSGFAGKHNYVSPEQLGLFGGDVTAKSDIYSLGLLLAEALTGTPINMGGTQFEIVEKRRKVPDLGAIDMRFRPLLEKMLQPDPARRPESMAAVANWALNPPGVLRRRTDPPRANAAQATAEAPRKSRRWWYVAAAIPLLGIIAGGGYVGYQAMQAPMPMEMPPLSNLGKKTDPDAPFRPLTPDQTRVPPASTARPTPPASPSPGPSASAPSTSNPSVGSAPSGLDLPSGRARVDKIRRFVEDYDGGDCFFAVPVAIGESNAVIEGFGAATRPFDLLDRAFTRENGFEASIGLRQVTQQQCPAVTFLGKLRNERARAPRLQVSATNLRSGDLLNGTIENIGMRYVELLLISDTGQVQNVTYALKDGIDAKTFSLGMQRSEGAAGQPQLLMAVASAKVMEALRPRQPVQADQFFLLALSEAARSGVTLSASARYFKLQP